MRTQRNKIREALCDPAAPWYGSDLVPLVADYLDAMEILALAPAEDEQPLDEAWLRSIGFKTKAYQGGAPLALKIHGGPVADPQWIETTGMDGAFLLCRWSPIYDDDTPPDRISVTANNRRELLLLLTALNASIPLASDGGN